MIVVTLCYWVSCFRRGMGYAFMVLVRYRARHSQCLGSDCYREWSVVDMDTLQGVLAEWDRDARVDPCDSTACTVDRSRQELRGEFTTSCGLRRMLGAWNDSVPPVLVRVARFTVRGDMRGTRDVVERRETVATGEDILVSLGHGYSRDVYALGRG